MMNLETFLKCANNREKSKVQDLCVFALFILITARVFRSLMILGEPVTSPAEITNAFLLNMQILGDIARIQNSLVYQLAEDCTLHL